MPVDDCISPLFQLIDIDGGFLNLMDDTGETREDIKVPEGDIGKEVLHTARPAVTITAWNIM